MDEVSARLVDASQHLSWSAALAARLWMAPIFWNVGMVKLQSLSSTIALLRYMYHVPLLPPVWAAYLGTGIEGIELVFPVLLVLGLAGRFAAAFFCLQHSDHHILSADGYGRHTGSSTLGDLSLVPDSLWTRSTVSRCHSPEIPAQSRVGDLFLPPGPAPRLGGKPRGNN